MGTTQYSCPHCKQHITDYDYDRYHSSGVQLVTCPYCIKAFYIEV